MLVSNKLVWQSRFDRVKRNYPFEDIAEEKTFILECVDADVEKLTGELYIEMETPKEMADRILKVAAGQRSIIANMMQLMASLNAMAEDECWDTYWMRVRTQAKHCGFVMKNQLAGDVDYSDNLTIRVAVTGVGEEISQVAYGFGKLGSCSDCPTPEQFGEAVNMVASNGFHVEQKTQWETTV